MDIYSSLEDPKSVILWVSRSSKRLYKAQKSWLYEFQNSPCNSTEWETNTHSQSSTNRPNHSNNVENEVFFIDIFHHRWRELIDYAKVSTFTWKGNWLTHDNVSLQNMPFQIWTNASWYQVRFLVISADREKTKTFTLLRHLWIVGYLELWGRSENENKKNWFFFHLQFFVCRVKKRNKMSF